MNRQDTEQFLNKMVNPEMLTAARLQPPKQEKKRINPVLLKQKQINVKKLEAFRKVVVIRNNNLCEQLFPCVCGRHFLISSPNGTNYKYKPLYYIRDTFPCWPTHHEIIDVQTNLPMGDLETPCCCLTACCCPFFCVESGFGPETIVSTKQEKHEVKEVGTVNRKFQFCNYGIEMSNGYYLGSSWTVCDWLKNRVNPVTACCIMSPLLNCFQFDCCNTSTYIVPIIDNNGEIVGKIENILPPAAKCPIFRGQAKQVIEFPGRMNADDKLLTVAGTILMDLTYCITGPADKKGTVLNF